MSYDPQHQQPQQYYGQQPGQAPGYGPGYGQQPTPYGYPGHQPVSYSTPTNTFAILALVMAFVFPILGIVFGVMARKQIDQSGEQGRGLATAGLVIGIVIVALSVIAIVAYILAIAVFVSTIDTTTTY